MRDGTRTEGDATGGMKAPPPSVVAPVKGARLARPRRWLTGALVVALVVAGAGATAAWLVVRHFEEGLPSITDLRGNYHPPQVTRVLAPDGTLLAELFTERRTVVAIGSLPPQVKLAVLAAEDADFYEHEGLNYYGIL